MRNSRENLVESIFLVESDFTVVDEFTLRLWSDKKNLRLKLESPKGLPFCGERRYDRNPICKKSEVGLWSPSYFCQFPLKVDSALVLRPAKLSFVIQISNYRWSSSSPEPCLSTKCKGESWEEEWRFKCILQIRIYVQYYSWKVETFAFIDFNGGNKRKLWYYCLQLSEHKYSFCFWV